MSKNGRFKVYAIPGASDTGGETHFAVKGPRVDEFTEQACSLARPEALDPDGHLTQRPEHDGRDDRFSPPDADHDASTL
jgi:hypothetical protein